MCLGRFTLLSTTYIFIVNLYQPYCTILPLEELYQRNNQSDVCGQCCAWMKDRFDQISKWRKLPTTRIEPFSLSYIDHIISGHLYFHSIFILVHYSYDDALGALSCYPWSGRSILEQSCSSANINRVMLHPRYIAAFHWTLRVP